MGLARNELKPQPPDELQRLREENARLKALLISQGIAWEDVPSAVPESSSTESVSATTQFTIADKIALFRRLFRGREDVYPQRWESAKGTSGYAPACGNRMEARHLPQAEDEMW